MCLRTEKLQYKLPHAALSRSQFLGRLEHTSGTTAQQEDSVGFEPTTSQYFCVKVQALPLSHLLVLDMIQHPNRIGTCSWFRHICRREIERMTAQATAVPDPGLLTLMLLI